MPRSNCARLPLISACCLLGSGISAEHVAVVNIAFCFCRAQTHGSLLGLRQGKSPAALSQHPIGSTRFRAPAHQPQYMLCDRTSHGAVSKSTCFHPAQDAKRLLTGINPFEPSTSTPLFAAPALPFLSLVPSHLSFPKHPKLSFSPSTLSRHLRRYICVLIFNLLHLLTVSPHDASPRRRWFRRRPRRRRRAALRPGGRRGCRTPPRHRNAQPLHHVPGGGTARARPRAGGAAGGGVPRDQGVL